MGMGATPSLPVTWDVLGENRIAAAGVTFLKTRSSENDPALGVSLRSVTSVGRSPGS